MRCSIRFGGFALGILTVLWAGASWAAGPDACARQAICMERGFASSDDGWRLAVRRYHRRDLDPARLPVVLCHGLALNGRFWSLGAQTDVPVILARRGFDVYVVNLRGTKESHCTSPGLARAALSIPSLRGVANAWTVDDLARHDVPAYLDYVTRTSGSAALHWVGHSLGGMIAFAYLEQSGGDPRIASLIALGSPTTAAQPPDPDLSTTLQRAKLLKYGLSLQWTARGMSVVPLARLRRIDRVYYNCRNVSATTVDRLYVSGFEDPSVPVMEQLGRMLQSGRFCSADGAYDYDANLWRIRIPTLLIGGSCDKIAPPAAMRHTFAGLGSAEKCLEVIGRSGGARADYGHCDLIWSSTARCDVLPRIVAWLEAHPAEEVTSP